MDEDDGEGDTANMAFATDGHKSVWMANVFDKNVYVDDYHQTHLYLHQEGEAIERLAWTQRSFTTCKFTVPWGASRVPVSVTCDMTGRPISGGLVWIHAIKFFANLNLRVARKTEGNYVWTNWDRWKKFGDKWAISFGMRAKPRNFAIDPDEVVRSSHTTVFSLHVLLSRLARLSCDGNKKGGL